MAVRRPGNRPVNVPIVGPDGVPPVAWLAFFDALEASNRPRVGDWLATLQTAAPSSAWLLANGADVSRTTYAEFFALVGTFYGPGDGVTTFALPTRAPTLTERYFVRVLP